MVDTDALDRLPTRVWWLGVLTAIIAVAASGLATGHDGPTRRRSVVVWCAASLGVYVGVPDTEAVGFVGAGLAVLSVAAVARRRSRPTPVALAGVAVLVVAAAAVGSTGRPPAMVGAAGAVSLAVLGPVVEDALGRRWPGVRLAWPVAVLVVGVTAVTAGRVAGVGRDWDGAVAASIGIGAAGLVAWVALLAVPWFRAPRRGQRFKSAA